MKAEVLKLYEDLFVIEEMLKGVVEACKEASATANSAGASSIAARVTSLSEVITEQVLNGNLDCSVGVILQEADMIPPNGGEPIGTSIKRVTEQEYPTEMNFSQIREHVTPEYEDTGNPAMDKMFNNLLESSQELEKNKKFQFKLDKEDKVEEGVQTMNPLTGSKYQGQAPVQPMARKSEEAKFDGMENWRSVLSEGSGQPSRAEGAGDMVNILANMNESDIDMGGIRQSANPPRQMNRQTDMGDDIDSGIMGALAGM